MLFSDEEINSEEKIIKIFKNKKLNEIKKIFRKKNIKIEQLNYLKNVALYLIKENFPFGKIKYIIEEQQQYYLKQQQSINNTELLFHSIEFNNYETTKLLLKYGTRITNLNTESKNIIEYLIEKRKLDSKKLFFILNIVNDASLITSEVLCQLIELKDFIFVKEVFQYKYYDVPFILSLLLDYRNKTKLSKKELQNKIDILDHDLIKINNQTKVGNYPILKAIYLNNIEIVELLIEYANKNNILLKLNENDIYENNPLLEAVIKKNTKIVKLLIEYATKNNIIFELNKKNQYENSPFSVTINNSSIEIFELLLEYASKKNIILELYEKDIDENYPFVNAYNENNIKMVEFLLKYDHKNIKILDLNGKDINGNYQLLTGIYNNNIEIVKSTIENVNKNNVILKLNEKNRFGNYPLLIAVSTNNIFMVQLIIEYANKSSITLELNEKIHLEIIPF